MEYNMAIRTVSFLAFLFPVAFVLCGQDAGSFPLSKPYRAQLAERGPFHFRTSAAASEPELLKTGAACEIRCVVRASGSLVPGDEWILAQRP